MSNVRDFQDTGWNTFDVRSLSAIVHFPTRAEVRAGLITPDGGTLCTEFRWPQMRRLGPHTPDCSYAEVELEASGTGCRVEFASRNDLMVARVSASGAEGIWPAAEVFFYGGYEGQLSCEGNDICAAGPAGTMFFAPASRTRGPVRTSERSAVISAADGGTLILAASPAPDSLRALNTREAEGFVRQCREEALHWESRFDDPDLQAAFEGMWRSVIWNTIYAPSIERAVTVVSRDWCVDGNYGDFVLFEWDTFFAALQSAPASRELAYANVRAVLSGVTERGFVPSIFCQLGKSRDRSMLPVGAVVVLKLYERFGDRDFLAEVFPALLRWHEWWMTARDGNGDGLLEWGSDDYPSPHPQWQSHTLQAARYESGLDNSPMYDDVEFDPQACTMTQTDIGLNAAYAMDAWALAEIAARIGNRSAEARLRAEHAEMSSRINDCLWSEEAGLYLNRRWNGSFSMRVSPTSFYPLIGRAAPFERAKRLAQEHLLNEREFWGAHVIPSISRSDPAYQDQEYWRGRIWGPMNWLVYEGLKASGFDDIAREMGRKCLRTFLQEWIGESHVHENYNGDTGEGDDVRYSEPVYFWGGLLALIALLESGQLKWNDNPGR